VQTLTRASVRPTRRLRTCAAFRVIAAVTGTSTTVVSTPASAGCQCTSRASRTMITAICEVSPKGFGYDVRSRYVSASQMSSALPCNTTH